jgi:ADP-ribosylglycohydrolase
MDKNYLLQHISGGLANALIGDSMGSATEGMTPGEIQEKYAGWVADFKMPPNGTFAAGRTPGQLTDDSTQMLEMLEAMIECQGRLTPQAVAEHLLKWAKNEELFGRFAGPSTRKAIQLLRDGKEPQDTGYPMTPLDMVSNGAAMKVAPIGLAHPGDLDAAVRDATTLCIPTHNTDVAYAAAAATAAGIAASVVPGATLLSVVDAALYGARQGYAIGKERARVVSSPSVVERIKLAVQIASSESDFDTACQLLGDRVGCGLPIVETVPVAFGLFLAARGDPNQAVLGAVNLGGDADSVATITGAISGAFAGIECINPSLVNTIEKVNRVQINAYAQKLVDLVNAAR